MYTRQGYFAPTEQMEVTTGQQNLDAYQTISPNKSATKAMTIQPESTRESATQEAVSDDAEGLEELYIYPPVVATGLDL